MSKIKIVVTGANGVVGSYFEASPEVYLATRSDFDIRNQEAVAAFFNKTKPETIIHLAAMTNVDLAEQKPQEAYDSNLLGTINIAKAAAKLDAHLLYVSTSGVFAGTHKKAYTVSQTPAPISVYTRSKYLGEVVCQDLVKKLTIARAGWIFGGKKQDQKFVGLIANKILAGEPELKIVNDVYGCPTYAQDLVTALTKLASKPRYGIHHVVNQGYATRYQIAEEMVKDLEADTKLIPASVHDFPTFNAPRPAFEVIKPTVKLRSWKVALKEYLKQWRKQLKVAIVIVSYNSTNDTLALLRSLMKLPTSQLHLSITLVDNGTVLKDYQRLLHFTQKQNSIPIKLIRNEKNVGLSKALNQALRYSQKSDYIWRLDNDVKVTKNTLKSLLHVAESYPDVGCVGSVAYNYDFPQKLFGGAWKVIWWRGSVIPISIPDKPITCDFVSGFSLLFPTSVIKKIGYLSDENYFAYSEDVDICRQVQQLGKKIYFDPGSVLYHRQTEAKNLNTFLIYLSIRNRILMMRKNASAFQLLTFTPYLLSVATLFNLKNLLSLSATPEQKIKLTQNYFKGIVEGFFKPFVKPTSVL